MRLMATLLLAALPWTATAQTPAPVVVVPQGTVVVPPPMALPTPRAPAGRFTTLPLQPPSIASLFARRSVPLEAADTRALGVQRWIYVAYEPGGSVPRPNRAIVVLLPPGMDPIQATHATDLRALARDQGWRLLMVPIPQTARVQSGTAGDIADAQRSAEGDPARLDRILAAVLAQESAGTTPVVVAAEGAGDGLLGMLCARGARRVAPSHALVLGGALDQRSAAACRPNRVPSLLIVRSATDGATPYGGGEQPALPGQPQTLSPNILSAAGTRGLWSVLARCGTAPPRLSWLPATTGRVALETHDRCAAGGPVAMLTTMAGASLPSGQALVDIVGDVLEGRLP